MLDVGLETPTATCMTDFRPTQDSPPGYTNRSYDPDRMVFVAAGSACDCDASHFTMTSACESSTQWPPLWSVCIVRFGWPSNLRTPA
eukprot:4341928-Prymnesium_polylepis.2